MEQKLTRQPLFINEVLLDSAVEQPIECDALLPDYCPDIVRILGCMVNPAISTCRLSPGRLDLEGAADLTVLYVTPDGSAARANYKVPFSKGLDLSGEGDPSASVEASARPGYINCRAVSSRRLDIRGAVSIWARVISGREEQVPAGSEDGALQLKKEPLPGVMVLGQCTREDHISETLEPAYGKPPVESILHWSGCVRISDCKAGVGKAVIKGELLLHVLYASAAGPQQMDYTLPVNAVAEIEGLSEDCLCDLSHEIVSLSLEPASDGTGEMRNMELDAVVQLTARGYKPVQGAVCTDCYCIKNPCEFRTKTVETMRPLELVRENFSHKETMALPDKVQEVLDMWCQVLSASARPQGSVLTAQFRLSVSMLAMMEDGEIYHFDRTIDVERSIAADGGDSAFSPRLSVAGCGFTFTSGESAELRCDLILEGVLWNRRRVTYISDVTVDEKRPKSCDKAPGLYIYLAEPEETMWDIAKRYNTEIRRIEEDNPPSEADQRRILLIPVL